AVVALAEQNGVSRNRLALPTPFEENFPTINPVDSLVGSWRRQKETLQSKQLFKNIMVSVGEDELSWAALEQALIVAQREQGQVRGLHVVTEQSDQIEMIEAFNQRVGRAGVSGELAFEMGDLYKTINDRSRWSDLVVLSLSNPPSELFFERWTSGWRNVILRSSRPVLAVPAVSGMHKALLAYDGSAKANEALFIAAHAAAQWEIPLVVLAAEQTLNQASNVAKARAYLESRGIEAEYVMHKGDAAINILLTAAQKSCDFILMGGYGSTGMVELFMGSTVDQVLRNAICPVLICR
ncbi:MAG: universal stress protein, partial [Anaerolineales bacterium]|nr:universal stress protein [Anaerolineales bacterium]